MVKDILTEAGFIENKTFRECRFLTAPSTTYAIYLDSYESRGADDRNLIKVHDYTIELYSYAPDPEAEKKLEASLDSRGLAYVKNERDWLESEGLYQVIYEFEFIEKNRRIRKWQK